MEFGNQTRIFSISSFRENKKTIILKNFQLFESISYIFFPGILNTKRFVNFNQML